MSTTTRKYTPIVQKALEDLRVALPEPNIRLDQDSEWCIIKSDKGWREIRFHDYGEIYDIPGLYEKIFYDILKCESPTVIRGMVEEELEDTDMSPKDLRILDLGAGNGMVGEELAKLGAGMQVGIDITPSAKTAVDRDRPEVYEDYFIADMTDLTPDVNASLENAKFNCLTCVAALGFGDIPPLAFAEAYRLIEDGGIIAFNIKDRFLSNDKDDSGFSYLIRRMIDQEVLGISQKIKYRHRIATNGDPLNYVALIGRKEAEIPDELLDRAVAFTAS